MLVHFNMETTLYERTQAPCRAADGPMPRCRAADGAMPVLLTAPSRAALDPMP